MLYCIVRLVGVWIKKREVGVGTRRIRSKKMREHHYLEQYVRSLQGKGVEWDGDDNVEYKWEYVKRVMVESARAVCGLVRVEESTQRV